MRINEPDCPTRNISLTPLVDIVFLLLVFFMLSTTFVKFGTVKLDAASSGGGVSDTSKMVLVHVESARGYKVNGIPTASKELISAVNRLVDEGAHDAIIVVRDKAAVDDLVNAVRLLRQSRASSVRIVEE